MEKENKTRQTLIRLILIAIAIAALLAIAWCVWYLVQYYQGARHGQEVRMCRRSSSCRSILKRCRP